MLKSLRFVVIEQKVVFFIWHSLAAIGKRFTRKKSSRGAARETRANARASKTEAASPAEKGKERLRKLKATPTHEVPNRPIGELLDDPDWDIRRDAILAIPITADEATILPLLKKALRDPDENVKLAAVQKLQTLQSPNVFAGLLFAFTDEDESVAAAAATAIQERGKQALPYLLEFARNKNVNVRRAAIECLGAIGHPAAVPVLIQCLRDEEKPSLALERICDLAASALLKINTTAARTAVQEWHKTGLQRRAEQAVPYSPPSESVDETMAMSEEIQHFEHNPQILTTLLDTLQGDDWQQRVGAAKALREYAKVMRDVDNPDTIGRLTALLRHEDWIVRWSATEALGWIRNKSTVPQLINIISDDNWTVRVAVIRALVEIDDESAMEMISNAVDDRNHLVREAAAEALGVLGGKSAISILSNATTDSEEFVRLAAVQALGKLADTESIEPLMNALTDSSQHVRWAAANALRQFTDERLVAGFIELLDDHYMPLWEDKRIQDFAVETLQRIDSLEARLALENHHRNRSRFTPLN